MFLGPSIHWSTYLKTYDMLLDHVINAHLEAGGVYMSINSGIGNPGGWTAPAMLIGSKDIRKATAGGETGLSGVMDNGWHPQVIGMQKGGTDKLSSRKARLLLGGLSNLKMEFSTPGE